VSHFIFSIILWYLFIIMVLINSDGAAALVLVSGEKALQLGLEVIAKITGYADAAQVTNLSVVKPSRF
jgi:3-oxoacyl-(acyl-carrier-protein) synthase